jgi:hypothetical protein
MSHFATAAIIERLVQPRCTDTARRAGRRRGVNRRRNGDVIVIIHRRSGATSC